MTVSQVVEMSTKRVAELPLARLEERREPKRLEACEFECLLRRAMEIVSIRARSGTASR